MSFRLLVPFLQEIFVRFIYSDREVDCDELFGTTTISKIERSKEELNRFKFQQEKLPISRMRGTAPEFAIEDPKKLSLGQSG
jgi:hypothetical protein